MRALHVPSTGSHEKLGWTGFALLLVLACCALGAAAIVSLPMTGAVVSIVATLLAVSGIVLIVGRPS
jgi:hypothetical protein